MPVRACVGVAALPLGCAVEMTIVGRELEEKYHAHTSRYVDRSEARVDAASTLTSVSHRYALPRFLASTFSPLHGVSCLHTWAWSSVFLTSLLRHVAERRESCIATLQYVREQPGESSNAFEQTVRMVGVIETRLS
jgi:hypothetical protein